LIHESNPHRTELWWSAMSQDVDWLCQRGDGSRTPHT